MLKAKRIKPGDTIGLFSPSSPISHTCPVRYERGRAFLQSKGFRVKEGSLTGSFDGYRSGSIQARAEELNALLRDPEVRCIMSNIGGMNSNALLPYLDYDAICADPKIMVGYSDVTALLLGIYEKTGLVTFYGPAAAASLGEFPPLSEETWGYFQALCVEEPILPYEFPQPAAWTDEVINWATQDRPKEVFPNQWVTLGEGVAEGRLIGGNLNTLDGIWGTAYMPEIRKGDILFIEDSLKDAATVERSFAHLQLAGVFDSIGGLILGKHEQFDDCGTGRTPGEILLEVMGEPKIPVLAQFDCCHTHPMLTMPLGCRVRLDASEQKVELLEDPLQ